MPRQLRNKGGITSIIPREKYGIGSDLKDFVRDIIPNEIADVAVKAAPFVAPFYPGTAALMRGIGRFDQRGSISDAIKQGTATYAFGKVAGKLGGAESGDGFFGGQTYSKEGFMDEGVGRLFKGAETTETIKTADDARKGFKGVQEITDATINKVPILRDLPDMVKDQIVFGGLTSAASYIYEKFIKEEPPQQEDETMEQYLARRKENVGRKMRTYFDNYFSFDKEYSQLDDAGRDAFVARYNLSDGGRIGYQAGGITGVTMASTLAQNIARNRAAQQAFRQAINPTQQKVIQRLQARQQAPSALATLGSLYNKKGIGEAQTKFLREAIKTDPKAYEKIGGGFVSDLRHKTAAAQLRDKLGGGITGEVAANVLGGIREIPQLLTGDFKGVAEDIKANFQGARNVPKGLTPQESFDYLIAQQQVDPGVIKPVSEKQTPLTASTKKPVSEKQTPLTASTKKSDFQKMLDETLEGLRKNYRENFPEQKTVLTDLQTDGTYSGTQKEIPLEAYFKGIIAQLARDPAGLNYDPKTGRELTSTEILEGRANAEQENVIPGFKKVGDRSYEGPDGQVYGPETYASIAAGMYPNIYDPRANAAKGGMPTGIMRTNKAGIKERDYRETGGFVPVGIKEKADDVPAMLSKNEFVFTADAVRGAGNGSIEKGAQRMYDTMKRLEKRVT